MTHLCTLKKKKETKITLKFSKNIGCNRETQRPQARQSRLRKCEYVMAKTANDLERRREEVLFIYTSRHSGIAPERLSPQIQGKMGFRVFPEKQKLVTLQKPSS